MNLDQRIKLLETAADLIKLAAGPGLPATAISIGPAYAVDLESIGADLNVIVLDLYARRQEGEG